MTDIAWKAEPEKHDYPAAESYLALLFDAPQAKAITNRLKVIAPSSFKAKDILRASGLEPLSNYNTFVSADLVKIRHGGKLSPVLLVRGQPMVIADGYHRVCAVYLLDENAEIPCRIVGAGSKTS